MAEIITGTELASYLRIDPATDLALLVELANGVVSEAVPSLLGPTFPFRVRSVTFEVAARAYRNPNGYSSETVDDYTYRRDADSRAAGVYLTDAERAELVGIVSGGVRRAGSIRVTSPWDATT